MNTLAALLQLFLLSIRESDTPLRRLFFRRKDKT